MEENKQPEKMSYEQLENIAHQLSELNRQMYMQIRNMSDAFKRLDYLLKIIENSEVFPNEYIEKCVVEIMQLMTIQEPEATEESKQ